MAPAVVRSRFGRPCVSEDDGDEGFRWRCDYSVDEFLGHVRAMATVRTYTNARSDYGSKPTASHVGDRQGFFPTQLRVMDYFSQLYPDRNEASQKGSCFILIGSWVAQHMEKLVELGYAIEEKSGAHGVAEPLLRAVFEKLALEPLSNNPTFEQIAQRADEIREELGEK